jgi:hypothetical protein
MPRAITSRSILANHNSTWLSQDEQVGVKCIWTLGFSPRKFSTCLALCAEKLSAIKWISLPLGSFATMSVSRRWHGKGHHHKT